MIKHFQIDKNSLYNGAPCSYKLRDQMGLANCQSNMVPLGFKPKNHSLLCHISNFSGLSTNSPVKDKNQNRKQSSPAKKPKEEVKEQISKTYNKAIMRASDILDDDSIYLPAWMFEKLGIKIGDPVCLTLDLDQIQL